MPIVPPQGDYLHRTGQGWVTNWTAKMVDESPDPVLAFAEYAQQVLGVPWPTTRDLVVLRSRIRDFFAHYPRADYFTLCRVVDWCRSRRRRFPRVQAVIDVFRDAYADGYLPELDPPRVNDNVEAGIERALQTETDVAWRSRLLGAVGLEARRNTLSEWLNSHPTKGS